MLKHHALDVAHRVMEAVTKHNVAAQPGSYEEDQVAEAVGAFWVTLVAVYRRWRR
jgi:hypothetical protein